MFVVKNCSVRGDAALIFTATGAPLLEQNAGLLTNDALLKAFTQNPPTGPSVNSPTSDHLLSLASTCTDCFWHWMMDSLPKAFLAEQSGYTGSYLLPNHIPEPIACESMSLLGVPRSRLIIHNTTAHNALNLYIPTYFSGFNAHHNTDFTRAFRSQILSQISPPPAANDRIYVARKPEARNRRIVNHADVETMVHQHGFRTIFFEDLSLRDQISTAAKATAMIAPHGSGMTHTLFMKERSSIIEIFPNRRQTSCDCYEQLAVVPQHHYCCIESAKDCGSDIEVDIASLRATLQNHHL
jgi:capsular polysaccharide biosynthesis protein